MGKTRRREPTDKDRKRAEMESIWESKAQHVELADEIEDPIRETVPAQLYTPPSLPPNVERIRAEAQAIVDSREKAVTRRRPLSVQAPATDDPMESGGAGNFIWWTGGQLDSYIPLSNYGEPSRTEDLRNFVLVAPLVQLAISVLTKKVQSLQWTIEGGRNLAQKWQKRLNNFENGDGWDFYIARWIRSYAEADKAACAELIRSAPRWAVDEDGQITDRGMKAMERGDDKAWEIIDSRVMDPVNTTFTTSTEFPLIFHNPYTGKRHQLRPYQFMTLIDMPSIDDNFPYSGTCAVSRAVWAAQEDRMIIRYSMEKMSENPGAGIALANVNANLLETALKSAKAERQARGVVYYKGIVFLPVLDPSGSTRLEFLSFSGLPDGFSRSEVYNILKEIVATAFGLDILELGSIPGRLGTATQAKVAAAKGRTKTLGAIMQGVERAFTYKLLPESVSFQIKKHDQDEELMRAQIDQIYFENAIRYSQFVNPMIAQQYLVDKGAVPNEYPYRTVDLTPEQIVADTGAAPAGEQEEAPEESGRKLPPDASTIESGPEGNDDARLLKSRTYDPRIRITRKGKVTYLEMPLPINNAYFPPSMRAKFLSRI